MEIEQASKPPYSALQIARWILTWADFEDDSLGVTNLKLQKLLYFAQGHHLAKFDGVLFSDRIQAWEHGPVIPVVYHEFKEFKAASITLTSFVEFEDFDSTTNSFLASIWRTFGGFDGWKLRELSHRSEPWAEAFSEEHSNVEIPVERMRVAFKSLYGE